MSWRKRNKKYEEIGKKILSDPNISPLEHEKLVLSLINDENEAAYELLGEYLLKEEPIIPVNYRLNFKGEALGRIKELIPDRLTRANRKFAQKVLLEALQKYFSFENLRKRLFEALARLNLGEIAANQLIEQLWTESPQSTEVKNILFGIIDFLSHPAQTNNLYWLLFTPQFLTQDFPTQFHSDVFYKLIEVQGESNALLMLIQAMAAELNKEEISSVWEIKGNYLKIFNEDAYEVLVKHKSSLQTPSIRDGVVENLHNVLKAVAQADDQGFLATFVPESSPEDMLIFTEQWKNHILSRYLLRSRILELLNDLNDKSAHHLIDVIQQTNKYQNLDSLKELGTLIREKASAKASVEILEKVEILVEIIDWDFEEILEGRNFSRLDYISDLLINIPEMLNLDQNQPLTLPVDIDTSSLHNKLTTILNITCRKAVRQYWYRKGLVKQIYKSTAFKDKISNREEKYQQISEEYQENPAKMQMHFNTLNDLLLKQKKRLLELMFSIDQSLLSKFIERLNDVLSRIYSYQNYYVVYQSKLNPQNPGRNLTQKHQIYDPKASDKLIKFYRYFEGMLEQEHQWNRYNDIAYRRIDAVIDLINDFITHRGHINFVAEYYNADAF